MSREWTWRTPGATHGVHTYEQGGLVWWSRPDGPNGRFGESAGVQHYDDFRRDGPLVGGVPEEVVAELRRWVG